MSTEYLWYIPNEVTARAPRRRGRRRPQQPGDPHRARPSRSRTTAGAGALLGTGWGRPDTFTVATALAARTTTFEPLIAIRPGYWRPANFASAAATLDHLTGGRVRINIVSGKDNLGAYGDSEGDQAHRYARTREFIRVVRRLWTEEDVTYAGEHFQRRPGRRCVPRIEPRDGRQHPTLYFGGASDAAERVAAAEADVQLFWGEPLDGVQERIERLRALSDQRRTRARSAASSGCGSPPWSATPPSRRGPTPRRRSPGWPRSQGVPRPQNPHRRTAVGQRRLLDLAARGEVLDDNLYTAPGRFGGGGAGTTWLVGSAGRRREVAAEVRGPRHHALRALRHPVPAGDRAAGRRSCSRCCASDPYVGRWRTTVGVDLLRQHEHQREADDGQHRAHRHRVRGGVDERLRDLRRVLAGDVQGAEQDAADDGDADGRPDALHHADHAAGGARLGPVDGRDDELRVRRDEQPAADARR